MNAEKLVEDGYDRICTLYHQRRVDRFWSAASDLDSLVRRLPPESTILDAGCGSGYIASKLQSHGFIITGIDISAKMLELARENSPLSTFLRMSMRRLEFPRESFDGVVCLYSMFHVPRRYHLGILKHFHRVLRPKGLLAIHMGWGDYVGIEENWLGSGAPMYWSHFGRGKNATLVRKAKFDIVESKASRQKDSTHLLILAQKS